jgi:hypothetical protein
VKLAPSRPRTPPIWNIRYAGSLDLAASGSIPLAGAKALSTAKLCGYGMEQHTRVNV